MLQISLIVFTCYTLDMPEKKISEKKRLIFYLLLFISLVSLLLAVYLGLSLYQQVGHRPPPIPRQTDVNLIQDWMTIPFIARSYRIPEQGLYRHLGIDSASNRRTSLMSLASKQGISTQSLISQIQEYITKLQTHQTEISPP
jgi:hypothetical protein